MNIRTALNAVNSLNTHLTIRGSHQDRDTVKMACRLSQSGTDCLVSYFPSEPNLFDVECHFNVDVADDNQELQVRRRLDILTQDYPFLRSHLEAYRGGALVRLCVSAELPVEAGDRSRCASRYLSALAGAVADLGVACEEAAAA